MFHRRNDWALTPNSPPQYIQISYVYELPIGTNKTFLNFSDWRRPLVNGWSISGAAYVDNGTPSRSIRNSTTRAASLPG